MKSITRFVVAVSLALPLGAFAQATTNTTATPQAGDAPSASSDASPKQSKTKRKMATKQIKPASDAGSPTTRSPSTPTTKNDGMTKP